MVKQIQYLVKYKLRSLQNDPWFKRRLQASSGGNLSIDEASTGAIKGEACLVFIF
jgi:hypothetical protein